MMYKRNEISQIESDTFDMDTNSEAYGHDDPHQI